MLSKRTQQLAIAECDGSLPQLLAKVYFHGLVLPPWMVSEIKREIARLSDDGDEDAGMGKGYSVKSPYGGNIPKPDRHWSYSKRKKGAKPYRRKKA